MTPDDAPPPLTDADLAEIRRRADLSLCRVDEYQPEADIARLLAEVERLRAALDAASAPGRVLTWRSQSLCRDPDDGT